MKPIRSQGVYRLREGVQLTAYQAMPLRIKAATKNPGLIQSRNPSAIRADPRVLGEA
jgi:hypothetical protein